LYNYFWRIHNEHLQLGADIGLSSASLLSSIQDNSNIASEPGFGFKVSAAYDFDSTMTGPALLLGGELLMDFIENEIFTGYAVFAKFVFK
jgi:hypothetical protein